MAGITTEQLHESEKRLFEAMKISDVATLDTLLHDDLLFMLPNGESVSKHADLDAHRAGSMVIEEAQLALLESRIIEDSAVSTVYMKAKGKMLGQPLEGEFRYIRIWKDFGGSLKVIGGSCIKTS